MKVKISYGIALCRYNENKNNRVEILLIKKRYSYQFFSFVMGHYKKSDTQFIKYLLNNMSYSEKIDIISMQFHQMWYRIWLDNPVVDYNIGDLYNQYIDINSPYSNPNMKKTFNEKRLRFENNFSKDGDKRLRALVQDSSNAEVLWEIPKGNKKGDESNLDCAIREFREETSINDNKYRVLYDVKPIVDSYIDNGVNYKTVYYIASLNKDVAEFNPYIDLKKFDQLIEIDHIKWVALAEIEFFNLSPLFHNRLIKLFKIISKEFKNSNKIHKIKY